MSLSRGYSLALVAVALLLIGQLLFKRVALSIEGMSLSQSITNQSAMITLGLACAIYAVATVFWVLALVDLPLGKAYTLTAIGFLVIPLLSHLFFHEPVPSRFLVGSVLIATGIILTHYE